jgi:hypothetical protein
MFVLMRWVLACFRAKWLVLKTEVAGFEKQSTRGATIGCSFASRKQIPNPIGICRPDLVWRAIDHPPKSCEHPEPRSATGAASRSPIWVPIPLVSGR